ENKVGLVAFIRENELVSVAEGGDAIRWTWPEREGKVSREPAAAFATRKLGRAAISPNRKLLAVINDDRTAGVEVVSL
ncbi:hypothetical protein, partial [Streptococcus suis]|uniref:hypothetical protein n=1 Tax=Streptococcus suis TaxID=1307 RepID=UPI00370A4146